MAHENGQPFGGHDVKRLSPHFFLPTNKKTPPITDGGFCIVEVADSVYFSGLNRTVMQGKWYILSTFPTRLSTL